MKYIRTKDKIYLVNKDMFEKDIFYLTDSEGTATIFIEEKNLSILGKQADTIEELIQIGDVVFYWSPTDDKEHCLVLKYDTEVYVIKQNPITKLFIPVGEDYKCVAKGYPSFNLIKNKKYLVNKGELELL